MAMPLSSELGVCKYKFNHDRLIKQMQLDSFESMGRRVNSLWICSPKPLSPYELRFICTLLGKKHAYEFAISDHAPGFDDYIEGLRRVTDELKSFQEKGIVFQVNFLE